MKACTNFNACLHGIDAENVSLRRDERHNALYLELDKDVSIRVDLNYPDELGRDLEGLRRLAEVVNQAAREIGPEAPEDDVAEDTGRLGEIRALLARFDWEHDDRQLALEAIERIVTGGDR